MRCFRLEEDAPHRHHSVELACFEARKIAIERQVDCRPSRAARVSVHLVEVDRVAECGRVLTQRIEFGADGKLQAPLQTGLDGGIDARNLILGQAGLLQRVLVWRRVWAGRFHYGLDHVGAADARCRVKAGLHGHIELGGTLPEESELKFPVLLPLNPDLIAAGQGKSALERNGSSGFEAQGAAEYAVAHGSQRVHTYGKVCFGGELQTSAALDRGDAPGGHRFDIGNIAGDCVVLDQRGQRSYQWIGASKQPVVRQDDFGLVVETEFQVSRSLVLQAQVERDLQGKRKICAAIGNG